MKQPSNRLTGNSLIVVMLACLAWYAYLGARGLPLPFGDFQFFHEPAIRFAREGVLRAPGLECVHPGSSQHFLVYPPGMMFAASLFYRLIPSVLVAYQLFAFLCASHLLLATGLIVMFFVESNHGGGSSPPRFSGLVFVPLFLAVSLPVAAHPHDCAVPISLFALLLGMRAKTFFGSLLSGVFFAVASIVSPLVPLCYLLTLSVYLSHHKRRGVLLSVAAFAAAGSAILYAGWFFEMPQAWIEFRDHIARHLSVVNLRSNGILETKMQRYVYGPKRSWSSRLSSWRVGIYFFPAIFLALILSVKGLEMRLFARMFFLPALLCVCVYSGDLTRISPLLPLLFAAILAAPSFGAKNPAKLIACLLAVSIAVFPEVKGVASQVLNDSGRRYLLTNEALRSLDLGGGPILATSTIFPILFERNLSSQNTKYCPPEIMVEDGRPLTVIVDGLLNNLPPGGEEIPVNGIPAPEQEKNIFLSSPLLRTSQPWQVWPRIYRYQ